jgi:hypothetical protein
VFLKKSAEEKAAYGTGFDRGLHEVQKVNNGE